MKACYVQKNIITLIEDTAREIIIRFVVNFQNDDVTSVRKKKGLSKLTTASHRLSLPAQAEQHKGDACGSGSLI